MNGRAWAIRVATLTIVAGLAVACGGDDRPACATTKPAPPAPARPAQPKAPAQHNRPQQPVRKVQPKPQVRSDGYRQFHGYPGWWAPGVYPPGYVEEYDCEPVEAGDPQ